MCFKFFSRDKLQDRMLFRVGYQYAPGQFEYITFGADKSLKNSLSIKIKGAKIFREKYGPAISFREVIVL